MLLADSYATGNADTSVTTPRLLVHPDQLNLVRAQRMARQLGVPDRLIVDRTLAQPWHAFVGVDAVMAQGEVAGLSLLWAMACNVPIVGESTYAISEIVEDRHSALLTKPNQSYALSHRLRTLFDDAQLSWKLRDTARHEAYSFFSRQRYCQSLQTVYEQMLAAQPVQVPAMEVTGGLRFTGRA